MLNALIIDDEEPARKNLEFLLLNYCQNITVKAAAENTFIAKELLNKLPIDIIFLDINMPNQSGIEFLEQLESATNYQFVFVTAHNEFAIRAIKASALDYLLKPIDIDELITAVEKAEVNISNFRKPELNQIVTNIKSGVIKKLCLPSMNGFKVVTIDEIIHIEADNNYSIFHLTDFTKIIVSKAIKEYEDILCNSGFFRIHKSSIINLNYLKEFSKIDGSYAVMSDKTSLAISRRRITDFLTAVEKNFS